jgi:hypothetical protein
MSFGIDVVVNSCVGVMRLMAEDDVDKAKLYGKQCYAIVKPMSRAVMAAAEAVDSWDTDATAYTKVVCTAKVFAGVFWPAARDLIKPFATPPKELDDVMAFVNVLATVTADCGPAK